MRKSKGFTLVELVIVIVIIGILSIVSVIIYKGYVKNAKAVEGVKLVEALQSEEDMLITFGSGFKTFNKTSVYDFKESVSAGSFDVNSGQKEIDARSNKYYISFDAAQNNDVYTVNAYYYDGAVIKSSVTLTWKADSSSTITIDGMTK